MSAERFHRDYKLTLEYITTDGATRSESELVHSYRDGFLALNTWLYKNLDCNYILISAKIKEI